MDEQSVLPALIHLSCGFPTNGLQNNPKTLLPGLQLYPQSHSSLIVRLMSNSNLDPAPTAEQPTTKARLYHEFSILMTSTLLLLI